MLDKRTPMGLTSLPNELLVAICRNLCLHCRLDHIVDCPDFMLADGRIEQRALAALSRTSTQLRRIAQAILYHYYHTGIPTDIDNWGNFAHQREEIRLMCSFVCSLLRRPDLANAVKAMSFFLATTSVSMKQPEGAESLLEKALTVLDQRYDGTVALDHLQVIAITLAPKLAQLLIAPNEACLFDGFKDQLPNIRYLVLPGVLEINEWDDSNHIQNHATLLSKTTGLECLVSIDCDGMINNRWFHGRGTSVELIAGIATDLSMLKKLCVSYCELKVIAIILTQCEGLVDLELSCNKRSREMVNLDWLQPCSAMLRRFRHTNHRRSTYFQPYLQTARELICGDDGIMWAIDDEYEPPNEYWAQFQHLSALEIIDIEQCALHNLQFHKAYCSADEIAEEGLPRWTSQDLQLFDSLSPLTARLPSSLRHLMVRSVLLWNWVYEDVMLLVHAAALFPQLHTVSLEVLKEPPSEEADHLTSSLQAVGVRCLITRMIPTLFDEEPLTAFRARLQMTASEFEKLPPEPQLEHVNYT